MRAGRVGVYSWQPRTDRWTWNPTMFRLHGYQPDAVTPTRALWMAHKHPASREHAQEVLAAACRAHSTYVCTHRIVGFDGRERDVVALGFPTPDTPWSSSGRRGYLLDVTPGEDRVDPAHAGRSSPRPIEDEAAAQRALAALDDHLHISPEAGVDLLAWLAGNGSVSVDAVVHRVVAAVDGPVGRTLPRRALLAVADPDLLPPPDR